MKSVSLYNIKSILLYYTAVAVYTVTNDSIDVENAWEEKSDTSKYSNGESTIYYYIITYNCNIVAQSYNVTENNDDSTSEDGGDSKLKIIIVVFDMMQLQYRVTV